MDHVITIGDVLRWSLVAGGIFAVVGFLLWLMAAFGRGMSR